MVEKEYIERETAIRAVNEFYHDPKVDIALRGVPTADVVKAKHGEWVLEVHSFYVDNWDESIELCVYVLASCSKCGEEHNPKQVFSKRLYAPEDADDDFRFDQEYEKSKALEEFKQKGYKFQNYCPNCGAKMKGGV